MNRLLLAATLTALVFVVGCNKQEQPKPAPQMGQEVAQGMGSNSVAGVTWTTPERWANHPVSSMRVASYIIPPQGGGDAPASVPCSTLAKAKVGVLTKTLLAGSISLRDPNPTAHQKKSMG